MISDVHAALVALNYEVSESDAKPDLPAIGALLVTTTGRTTLMALVPYPLNPNTALSVTRSLHPAPPGVDAVTTGFLDASANTLTLHDGLSSGGTLHFSPSDPDRRQASPRRPRTGRPPRPRAERTYRYVYLIYAPSFNRVKIGTSQDPDRHARDLRAAFPEPTQLEVLATTAHPVSPYEETILHRRFAAQRTHGEWFSDDILDDARSAILAIGA